MGCRVCWFIRHYALNWALAIDKLGNTLLAGDPNETISRRTARAREAGQAWAKAACCILSFMFGRDHCGFALAPGTSGKELWSWSDNFSEPDLDAAPAPAPPAVG